MNIHESARSQIVRQALSSLRCSIRIAAALLVLATGCGKKDESIRGDVDEFATHVASLKGRSEVNVDFGFSDITDDDLGALAFPDTVTEINLRYTKVTDEGLVHLTKLPRLEILDLSGTQVSDAGVDRLRELPNLCRVNLHSSLVSLEKQRELIKELIPREHARNVRRAAAIAKHEDPSP